MSNFFELMSRDILPSIRAVMAKKLLENGFSQGEVAARLGLTQPAISQYKRGARGSQASIVSDKPEVMKMADSLAKRLASGQVSPGAVNLELLDMCREFLEQA